MKSVTSKVTRKVLVPGEDPAIELEEAETSLAELASLLGTARSQTAQNIYREQMEALDARIADLENTPIRPDEWREEGTGVTYREKWESSDNGERRRLLLDAGITVRAKYPPMYAHLYTWGDVLEKNFSGYDYANIMAKREEWQAANRKASGIG